MQVRPFLQAMCAIVICEAAGLIGTIFTASAIPTWYAGLVKPPLNPPSWVFGPVWTALYACMGIAAFLVWRKGIERPDVKRALTFFGVQLVLNAIWSPLFFGYKHLGIAFLDIGLLWLSILATMILFRKLSKPAFWLLIPYLLWVSFASYLNAALWYLNK